MTIIDSNQISNLRRAYAKARIDQAALLTVPFEDMAEQTVEKAVSRLRVLEQTITPDELRLTYREKPAEGVCEFIYQWEPSLEHYRIRLEGGPKDGELMRLREENKGSLTVAIIEPGLFDADFEDVETVATKQGDYKETGWDTTEKQWIYTWTGEQPS